MADVLGMSKSSNEAISGCGIINRKESFEPIALVSNRSRERLKVCCSEVNEIRNSLGYRHRQRPRPVIPFNSVCCLRSSLEGGVEVKV